MGWQVVFLNRVDKVVVVEHSDVSENISHSVVTLREVQIVLLDTGKPVLKQFGKWLIQEARLQCLNWDIGQEVKKVGEGICPNIFFFFQLHQNMRLVNTLKDHVDSLRVRLLAPSPPSESVSKVRKDGKDALEAPEALLVLNTWCWVVVNLLKASLIGNFFDKHLRELGAETRFVKLVVAIGEDSPLDRDETGVRHLRRLVKG